MRTSISAAGLTAALASSICCLAPALAAEAGTSSAVVSFAWLEPFRSYLIGTTAMLIGFAWYQHFTSKPADTCECEPQKKPFMQTKACLSITTVASLLLLAYPSFSGFVDQNTTLQQQPFAQKSAYVTIQGMTCTGCEAHVKQEVSKVKGVSEVAVSYEKGKATVKYDEKKTSLAEIKKAIGQTGYKAVAAKTL